MGLLTDKENGLLNESSLAEARKAKVVYLDLDDIKQYEWNIWTPDDREIEHRMENIQEVGLLQPLLVMKTEEGIMLNSGHKRYLAIKKAFLTSTWGKNYLDRCHASSSMTLRMKSCLI